MFKHLFLTAFLTLLTVAAIAQQPLRIKLSEGIGKHLIQVSAVSTGKSYKERGLKIIVNNKTGSTIRVTADAGALFIPSDSSYQPLVLAGEELLTVAPWKDFELEVQTFCADSRRSSPVKDIAYTYNSVVNDTLVNVLQFLKKNFLLDGLGQSAVWAFTNGHSLNQVYDPLRERASQLLLEHIVKVSGRTLPTYHTLTKTIDEPGTIPYDPKPLKIIGTFEQKLDAAKSLTLGVFNEAGATIQSVFQNKTFGKGGHRFKVEFEAADAPAGTYYLRLLEGETLLQEQQVVVP